MWPEIKVSRVLGVVEYPETLFYIYLTQQCDFKCFQLVLYVLTLQQVLF